MIHIMHYMSILKLSDEIIKTYGRYPDERDPGLQSARKIYKAAFGELVRQGMPYTKKAGLLKIETDGEVYAANKYLMEGVHTDQTREGKEHAAPVPAFSYAPYVMAQADDDEDLDVTKVMSFTEAMDRERAGEKEGQESTDEEYVQTASELLKEEPEAAATHDENEEAEEKNFREQDSHLMKTAPKIREAQKANAKMTRRKTGSLKMKTTRNRQKSFTMKSMRNLQVNRKMARTKATASLSRLKRT